MSGSHGFIAQASELQLGQAQFSALASTTTSGAQQVPAGEGSVTVDGATLLVGALAAVPCQIESMRVAFTGATNATQNIAFTLNKNGVAITGAALTLSANTGARAGHVEFTPVNLAAGDILTVTATTSAGLTNVVRDIQVSVGNKPGNAGFLASGEQNALNQAQFSALASTVTQTEQQIPYGYKAVTIESDTPLLGALAVVQRQISTMHVSFVPASNSGKTATFKLYRNGTIVPGASVTLSVHNDGVSLTGGSVNFTPINVSAGDVLTASLTPSAAITALANVVVAVGGVAGGAGAHGVQATALPLSQAQFSAAASIAAGNEQNIPVANSYAGVTVDALAGNSTQCGALAAEACQIDKLRISFVGSSDNSGKTATFKLYKNGTLVTSTTAIAATAGTHTMAASFDPVNVSAGDVLTASLTPSSTITALTNVMFAVGN